MKNISIIILLLLLTRCSDFKEDYSSPESTLTTFISAVEHWDSETISNCFEDTHMQGYAERHKKEIVPLYTHAQFKIFKRYDDEALYYLV